MIKVLIADDSPTIRMLFQKLIEAEPDMEIVGFAKNGKEACELAKQLKPNIITMDIEMPFLNGFEATRKIMSENPTPIVVISSKVRDNTLNTTFEALQAGALTVLEKPSINDSNFIEENKKIVDTIRSMAEIKVVRRRVAPSKPITPHIKPAEVKRRQCDILGIGTSVGGPQTLIKILSQLDAHFPVPIVIVQHMTKGFIKGFTEWLKLTIPIPVKVAEHGEKLKNGTVYFAPDDYHLKISKENSHYITQLKKGEPVSGFCPSITVLFESIAKACGKDAIGLLLTGMGSDGAEGLLSLKKAGALTVIQDPESCVVFGMAGVAQTLGAVDVVVNLDQIASYLKTEVNAHHREVKPK